MTKSMDDFLKDSSLYGANFVFIENLFEQYCLGEKVPERWAEFFSQFPDKAILKKQFFKKAVVDPIALSQDHSAQLNIQELIQAYRIDGHLQANINPLSAPKLFPQLQLSYHGLERFSQKEIFDSRDLIGPKKMSLSEILEALTQSYCGPLGVEYMHISSLEQRRWIQQRIEGTRAQRQGAPSIRQQAILERLIAAEGLEKYLGARYPGAKRFSLEGGDSLIVLLDEVIDRLGYLGTKEIVLAMAHRGRLNALVNILGKSPQDLFDEFEGKTLGEIGSGDVKYHQGFSSDLKTSGGSVHLSLAFNPSHLEIVTPVAIGSVAARMDKRKDTEKKKVVPVVVHGDSAFSGQGVVFETLNMSKTRGYAVGGTIHIVINNQVGFTTSNPKDTRSTLYCTDIAKMIDSPILHVNADQPEAVWHAAQLAVDFRYAFGQDIVIDLVCYRRHGHNEADEPAVTQPVMYQKIRNHQTVATSYGQTLVERGIYRQEEIEQLKRAHRKKLETGKTVAFQALKKMSKTTFDWSPYLEAKNFEKKVSTKIKASILQEMGKQLGLLACEVDLHPRVKKIYDDRALMIEEKKPFDWGAAENLAYASLLAEGYPIRLSGQDSGRGTFFHRHCRLRCQRTGEESIPLSSLGTNKGGFVVIDSLLSEEAVMAFEYGYAATDPSTLVIWEAQFGDFSNGAQVVIDQFISSGEQKWGRYCGLTLLLPHGYEGQGPEHSSARLERFLQLSAEHNMFICYPTTPAQIFHLLRRQMLQKVRRPLVIMSPKSLLRHKKAVSSLQELSDGCFEEILVTPLSSKKTHIKRILLVTGKIYYDLLEYAQTQKISSVLLVRLEQLYPFPKESLDKVFKDYQQVKEVRWVQEEPKNQGSWYSQRHNMQKSLRPSMTLEYVGREDSAAPACGYFQVHKSEQEQFIKEAFKELL